jgi:predicted transcriptional regulator
MKQTTLIQNFKLNQHGLAHIFGELEAKLMEAVWALGSPGVKNVVEYWHGNLNYKTTMTVLNRLVQKGILTRRKSGRIFVYQAAVSQKELLTGVFDQITRDMLSKDFRPIALPQMVETAQTLDPDILTELADLIEKEKINS